MLADQDRFFGRGTDSKTLLELWQDNRITLLAGPVASGKTSLLNAGVLPLLKQNHTYFLPAGRISYGSTFPRAALPEHNPYTLALLQSWSPGAAVTQQVDLTVRDFFRAERGRQHGLYGGPFLAAIDQVDDLLADPGPQQAHRQKFLEELTDAVQDEPGLHLLLLAREETAARISEVLGGAAVYNLTALTRQDAIEAVTGPVAGTGRSFADGAAEKLVTDLQSRRITGLNGAEQVIVSDGIEPSLLQVVCLQLWNSLPPDTRQVTVRDVRVFGDADKALATYCSGVVAAVADDHDLRVRRLRTWLLDTFVTELGTQGTAYEGLVTTAGIPNAVARALEDRHLLSAARRSGSRWYELLSARLIEPLQQAVDVPPPAAQPAEYLSSAERALTRGELDAAERYAQSALRTAPDTDLKLRAGLESLLGNIAIAREKPAEAESRYRIAARLFEAVRDTPAAASQLAAVGQTLVAQDRLQEAVDEFRAAIDRVPSDPVMQTDLALALWRLGESRAAVSVLTAFLLRVDGGNSVVLRARGEILADLGEARQAISDLDRVTLEQRPSSRAARGLALAKLGDQPRANVEVDDAVAEAPRNGAVLLYAARAKALGGDEYASEELACRAVDATDLALSPYHREVALRLAAREHGNPRAKLFAGVFHGLFPESGNACIKRARVGKADRDPPVQIRVPYHVVGEGPRRDGYLVRGLGEPARHEQSDARRMQPGSLGVIQHFFHPGPHSVRVAAITANVLRLGPQVTGRSQQFHAGIARRGGKPLAPVPLGLTDLAYHRCGLRDQRPDEASARSDRCYVYRHISHVRIISQ
jgi:tetratricopeptide (TPR) repeat protein